MLQDTLNCSGEAPEQLYFRAGFFKRIYILQRISIIKILRKYLHIYRMSPPNYFPNILESHCFVINLDYCTDRWNIVSKRIENAGFTNISKWVAINGKSKNLHEQWIYPRVSEDCSPEAKACFLSHINIWKHIVREKIPVATIFEDDVLFHPKWSFLSNRFYQLTPKDFDILYLGSEFHPKWMAANFPEYKVNAIDSIPIFCTHAYTVTYEGALKLLEIVLQSSSLFQIDLFLWSLMKNHLLYKEPAPFVWYSWQGMDYPCKELSDMHPRWQQKNTGLVFQDYIFGSIIDPELYISTKKQTSLWTKLKKYISPHPFFMFR